MKEINFDNPELFYSDDYDFNSMRERVMYGIGNKKDKFDEASLKESWSFTDLDDAILSDEFGDTSAPNSITDNYKYLQDGYKSIFKTYHKRNGVNNNMVKTTSNKGIYTEEYPRKTVSYLREKNMTMLDVFENPALKIQIKKDISKIRTLESILEINSDAVDTSKFFNTHIKLLEKVDIELLQNIAIVYLRYSQTPSYQTLQDWKHINSIARNKKTTDVMWELIHHYQYPIKNTWDI
jgi:hypothetical protein